MSHAEWVSLNIRAYSKGGGFVEVHGPSVEGQNGHLEIRERLADFQDMGHFKLTGRFFPYLPYDLRGEQGFKSWLSQLESKGFQIEPI